MTSRGRVFVLFRSGLGLVFLAAFLSLAVQLRPLVGSHGLLPWGDFIARLGPGGLGFLSLPSLFLWIRGDAALTIVPLAGAALALLLILGLGGRLVVFALWFLYLSCVTAGRDFFYYQWDNLLLEASFLSIFLPGRGTLFDLTRGRAVPEPPSLVVLLTRWLLFRLLFESGLAKIAAGEGTWLNLSAMTYYYETAPLPSWGGWLAQQSPLWFHQLSVLFTFFVELPLACLVFLPRRFRLIFFVIQLPFQISIGLTSNYGFFNLLSIVLSLSVLEDRDLGAPRRLFLRLARRLETAPPDPPPVAAAPVVPVSPLRRIASLAPAVLLAAWVVPASVVA